MIKQTINEITNEIKGCFFSKESPLTLFVCILWGMMLVEYSRGIITKFPIIGDYVDVVMVLIVVVPLLFSIPLFQKKFTLYDLLFYFSLVFVYLINYIEYPENQDSLEAYAFICICQVFPYYFIGRILDIEKFYRLFVIIAVLTVCFYAFYFMFYVQSVKSAADAAAVLSEDNMYAAYQLLPHVAVIWWATLRKFNVILCLFGLLGIVSLISCGSRGPVACLLIYIVSYFFLMAKFRYSKYTKAVILAICFFCATFAVETALVFKAFFSELGLSTRIVDRFLNGGLGHDTGRSDLRRVLYNLLDQSDNFFGYGFFGSQRYGIIYAHNIICDLIFTFGYIIGVVILMAIILLTSYAFIKSRGTFRQQFLFMMICIEMVKMCLSATFLTEPLFYLLIGYCVTICITPYDKLSKRE